MLRETLSALEVELEALSEDIGGDAMQPCGDSHMSELYEELFPIESMPARTSILHRAAELDVNVTKFINQYGDVGRNIDVWTFVYRALGGTQEI